MDNILSIHTIVLAIIAVILFVWLALYGKENPIRKGLIDIGVVDPLESYLVEGVAGKKFRLPSVRDI